MGKIVFAGGGTAGHIQPALAVAKFWHTQHPSDEIVFIGTPVGLENQLVPASGFSLTHISKVAISRSPSISWLSIPFQIFFAVLASRKILKGAQVLIGFGGYVSAPPYLAARSLGIPIVIHEANAKPGWANRIGSLCTNYLAISQSVSSTKFSKALLTGMPLRLDIADALESAKGNWQTLRLAAKARLGFSQKEPLILVMGGSQGSQAINAVLSEALPQLQSSGIQIMHSSGTLNGLPKASQGYKSVAYIENMADALLAADLVIARSGAVTCSEFSALGRYALFVPLPIGNGEQFHNAKNLVATGRAQIVDQENFTPKFLIDNAKSLLAKSGASAISGNFDDLLASEKIARLMELAINSKTKPEENFKPTLNSFIGKRIHFIGIGGAGMSGLARIALSHKITVSGSDAKDSSVLSALHTLGATVSAKHTASAVDGSDLVVYSTAISEKNPELIRAIELEIPIMSRAYALAMLMSDSKRIAVAGTHGKTTTSSMLAVALQACGEDPSFAIGGTVTASGSNAHRGTGNLFVAEADESDGSFVAYHPFAAIVTNVEHDHVDYFATLESVHLAFRDFVRTINPQGFLAYCGDDKGASALAKSVENLKTVSYGQSQGCDLLLDNITLLPMGSTTRAIWHGKSVGLIQLQVPGLHNLLNAGAVLATGITLGLSPAELITGLSTFSGTGRRFELKATVGGIRVIDDYGHHPTEIEVTLKAARLYAGDGRILVIFQPHRYSRTQAFHSQFASALDLADRVILLEVYAASEQEIPGISAEMISTQMKRGEFVPNFIEATDLILAAAKPGDVILTLGAGDVSSLAPIIVEGLTKRFSK